MKDHLLSIVIPLYNEEGNLQKLYEELKAIIPLLTFFTTHEMIFVNDGSIDQSLQVLKTIAQHDHHVKIISFTRNFGHEYASYAGIIHASGEGVVLIDSDLQHPPSLIPLFEKEFLQGYHIVFGQRTDRLKESFFKKMTSKAFYPFFKALTKIDMPRNVGDFCLLSKKAVEILKQMPEKTLFVRGLIYWSGLSKKAVPCVLRARNTGKSKYNYPKLIIFALENIISFSSIPLYLLLFISGFMVLSCLFAGIMLLLLNQLGSMVITKMMVLITLICFLFSSMLACISLIGLYIGKITQEIKQRPRFLIDEKINFETLENVKIGARIVQQTPHERP